MSWLTDQITLNDVEHVVQRFYTKARVNPQIGHFFNRIENFDSHIKTIAVFWWLALGGSTADLTEAPPAFDMMNKHLALGINEKDLEVWLGLFRQTLLEELEPACADFWETKLAGIASHLKTLVIDGRPGGLQINEPAC